MSKLLKFLSDLKFIDVFNVVLEKKITFLTINAVLCTCVLFYALSLNNYYRSEAILYSDTQEETSNFLSQYSGLASMAGINLPQTGDAIKSDLALSTLRSKEFFSHLVETDKMLLVNLLAYKKINSDTGRILIDKKDYDIENDKWVRQPKGPYGQVPDYLEGHKEFHEKVFRASKDTKTGFITISVETVSPIYSQELLSLVIKELNAVARLNQINESNEALKFLKLELQTTTIDEVKRSINKLIETELKTKMLANINEDYLLKVIDRPFIPDLKSRPKRSVICILGGLISLILSVFTLLILKFRKSY